MARIRSIKPEFWTDEKVVALSPLARLLFIGIWNFVDDYGRAPYSPTRLKMQILPADSADISELLGEIRRECLIVVYSVDGKEYFEVRGFSKHQKIDKRSASKHPPPPNSAEPSKKNPLDQGREGIKEEEKIKRADARDEVSREAKYAFDGGVIKLSQKHFDDWTRAYVALDLRAELTARDAWLGSERATDDDRRNWFLSTSRFLANRNLEAKAKTAALKPDKFSRPSTIPGVL